MKTIDKTHVHLSFMDIGEHLLKHESSFIKYISMLPVEEIREAIKYREEKLERDRKREERTKELFMQAYNRQKHEYEEIKEKRIKAIRKRLKYNQNPSEVKQLIESLWVPDWENEPIVDDFLSNGRGLTRDEQIEEKLSTKTDFDNEEHIISIMKKGLKKAQDKARYSEKVKKPNSMS